MNKKWLLLIPVLVVITGFFIFRSSKITSTPENITSSGENEQPILGETVNTTVVYFFWGDGCPHCAAQKPFLEEMKNKYPELVVKEYETWKNTDNAILFQEMAAAYGIRAQGVPTTFIGDFEPIVGYADYMAADIEEKIIYCLENGCIDPGTKL